MSACYGSFFLVLHALKTSLYSLTSHSFDSRSCFKIWCLLRATGFLLGGNGQWIRTQVEKKQLYTWGETIHRAQKIESKTYKTNIKRIIRTKRTKDVRKVFDLVLKSDVTLMEFLKIFAVCTRNVIRDTALSIWHLSSWPEFEYSACSMRQPTYSPHYVECRM